MSHIVVTQKGRELQRELLEEQHEDEELVDERSFTIRKTDTVVYDSMIQPSQNFIRPSPRYTGKKADKLGILGQMTINETIKHDFKYVENEDPTKTDILDKMLWQSKFLQKKLGVEIRPTSPKGDPGAIGSYSIPTIPQMDSYRTSIGMLDQNSSMQSLIHGNQSTSLLSAGANGGKYGKGHVELEVTRLVERHIVNEKKQLKTAEKVLQSYEKRVTEMFANANRKSPNPMDIIREKMPDAVDVLMRNTNSMFRKKKRLGTYYDQKFGPYQRRFSSLTTQRFEERLNTLHSEKEEY